MSAIFTGFDAFRVLRTIFMAHLGLSRDCVGWHCIWDSGQLQQSIKSVAARNQQPLLLCRHDGIWRAQEHNNSLEYYAGAAGESGNGVAELVMNFTALDPRLTESPAAIRCPHFVRTSRAHVRPSTTLPLSQAGHQSWVSPACSAQMGAARGVSSQRIHACLFRTLVVLCCVANP